MIELFGLIKKDKTIKIKCDNLSYWRSDRPTELVNYIKDNQDYFHIEQFYIKEGRVFDNIYIQAFDIELYMSDETYDQIMEKFRGTIARYNAGVVDISLYEYSFQE